MFNKKFCSLKMSVGICSWRSQAIEKEVDDNKVLGGGGSCAADETTSRKYQEGLTSQVLYIELLSWRMRRRGLGISWLCVKLKYDVEAVPCQRGNRNGIL